MIQWFDFDEILFEYYIIYRGEVHLEEIIIIIIGRKLLAKINIPFARLSKYMRIYKAKYRAENSHFSQNTFC